MASQSNEALSALNANPFVVGQYVDVQSRTWPGINKPGGIGRVSGVSEDRVSVRYLVGQRHEKEISIQYVKPYDIPSERLRDRALLKGRCTRCGSLRNDCGSCDLSLEQISFPGDQTMRIRRSVTRPTRRLHNGHSDLVFADQPEQMDFDLDSNLSSSSSDEDIELQDRRYRQYTRLKRRAQRILENRKEDSDSSEELEEENLSDNDDIPLRQLVRQELLSQLSPVRANQGSRYNKSRSPRRRNHRFVLDDSSDSEIELASLSDASSSRSVSLPGTQDLSVDRTQQDIMDPLVHGDNDSSSSSVSEESYVTLRSNDELVLDSTLGGFIQPEGDATRMPRDTVDQTATLQFAELGPFFDDLAHSLEQKTLPWARAKVKELVQQFETDRSATESHAILLERCSELYDKLVIDLVRNGIDQCQKAVKKLGVKPNLQYEKRELLCDQLRDAEKEIMRELTDLQNSLKTFAENESDNDEVDSKDGWAEPEESPLKSSDQDIVESLISSQSSSSLMDPHPYASKKRRAKASIKSKNKSSRSKSGKFRRRKSTTNNVQGLNLEIVDMRHYDKENRDDPVPLRSTISRTSFSKTRRRSSSEAVREPGRVKRSETAVERMERFLLLNNADAKENMLENEKEEADRSKSPRTSIESRSFERRRSRLAEEATRQKQGVRRNCKSDECVSMPQMQNGSLSHHLLQCLRSQRPGELNHGTENSESISASSRALVDVCDDLAKVFPHSASCSLFKEVLYIVSSPDGQTDNSMVFNLVLSLLKNSGLVTLQELVSQDCSHLETFVALYVFILKLLKNSLHCSLSAHHGILYELFGAGSSKFIDFIFLQFLDAVYALAHPDAWVLKVSDRRKVFESLAPLRDALGEHLVLIEQAASFIDKRLGTQIWRLVPSRRALFVSSIDPDSWNLYIEKAIEPECVAKSRFRSIGCVPCIPRVEVETIWRVLVYLSASTPPTIKLKKGWTFISDLFQNGVFRMSEKTGSPSVSHMEAVEADINTFSSIISSRAMGPLPSKDTLVVQIIMKALLLHADALWHSEEFREAQLPSMDNGKIGSKRELSLSESWSDLRLLEVLRFVPIAFTELFNSLLRATVPTKSSTFSIGPSSRMLHLSLVLQFEWMTSAQRDCDQAFRVLINYFREESKKLLGGGNNTGNCDAFQDAFPDSSILICKGGLPASRKSLFLQECATYLSIVAQMTKAAARSVVQNESTLLEIVKNTWEMLGCDELGNPEEQLEMSTFRSLDILRPYVMGRALNFLLSCALGTVPRRENETTIRKVPELVVDEEAIRYILSGLMRCLEVSSFSGCSDVICSMAIMVEKIILADASDRRCFDSIIDVLVGSCLSTSINTIKLLVKATYCGVEDEICLNSVLSLVRTVLSFRKMMREETEPAILTDGHPCVEEAAKLDVPTEDEFVVHLNDDELLSMMESVEGNPSEGRSTCDLFQKWQQLRFVLSESLRCARPSLQFEVFNANKQDLRMGIAHQMSANGKLLVSKHVKAVSMTLVSVVVSEQSLPASSLADLVDFEASGNMEDEEYRRKVLLNCCRTLCKFTSSPKARSMMKCSASSMVYVFMYSLLDFNGLQNVPSCNFDRLPDNGRDGRKRKAIDEFLKFSSGNSWSRKVATIWTFCRELGIALSKSNGESFSLFKQIGTILSEPEWDGGDQAVACSLEKEYLCRFQCIRGIISTHRHFYSPGSRTFSELCAEIIARSCEGLLRILKLLHVEEVASNGSLELSYAEFRLTELFRCHAEFFTSIIAWMCSEGSQIPITNFSEVWTIVCTDFIAPMISSDTTGVYTCIERTYASISHFLKTPPLSFPKFFELETKNAVCHRILSRSLLRFSREILLPTFVLESRTPHILDKLLSAALRDSKATSKSICRIFFNETLFASSCLAEGNESKLFQHLSRYWDELLTKYPLDSKLERDLVDLKQDAIKTLAALAKRNKGESRQGALYIINSLLRRERKEASPGALKLEALCSLVRALPIILKESLLELSVDEEVVALIYKCLLNISRRRANKDEDVNRSGWYAATCLLSEHQDPETLLSSKYVTTALQWFEAVGKVVLGQTDGCDSERMRVQLGEDNSDGWVSWGSVTCSADLVHLSHEMKEIEKGLFPSPYPDRVVLNVYAAAKRTSTADVMIEKWLPSSPIRQVIQRFCDK